MILKVEEDRMVSFGLFGLSVSDMFGLGVRHVRECVVGCTSK